MCVTVSSDVNLLLPTLLTVSILQEKRGFRECRLLENMNKLVYETKEQVLPRCTKSMQANLPDALNQCV